MEDTVFIRGLEFDLINLRRLSILFQGNPVIRVKHHKLHQNISFRCIKSHPLIFIAIPLPNLCCEVNIFRQFVVLGEMLIRSHPIMHHFTSLKYTILAKSPLEQTFHQSLIIVLPQNRLYRYLLMRNSFEKISHPPVISERALLRPYVAAT